MPAIFWFRRDLRLDDNHGLFRALKENTDVIPLFIFDKNILSKLEDRDDARVTFIYNEILSLNHQLEKIGSSIIIKYGDPVETFQVLITEYSVIKVFANHDYEPYARDRDEKVSNFLQSNNIDFQIFKDQVIFEKDEILKENGKPYTVFTPYMKRWKIKILPGDHEKFDISEYQRNFYKFKTQSILPLSNLGFRSNTMSFPGRMIDSHIISDYDRKRDFPYLEGTSRLGIHLRFGTISIRQLAKVAQSSNEIFLNELIWREFYTMILWHFPNVVKEAFKPRYELIQWRNDEEEFNSWCEGRTGYPFVDAGMRQLNETGYMHNRLRMITASFLTKLLLIDWRWGEAYFARKLLDFELASNNGGWQWSAGTGCDAAPYFRIFNPDAQTKNFDPKLEFINKWIPELGTEQYPVRLVEYKPSRERALRTFREVLK